MAQLVRCRAAILAACFFLPWFLMRDARAADGDTLAQIRARGILRCGVSEGVPGFSSKDGSGRWTGIDVDFCRAVAAAALGDPAKTAYVPLKASARFPALNEGIVDLLARNTTWTLLRESALKVQFAGVLFYDFQGFLVRRPSGARTAAELKGATVCVEKGTSTDVHLRAYSTDHQLDIRPLVLDSTADANAAFYAGRCSAYAGDSSLLVTVRAAAPNGPQSADILPGWIAKEPLGPVVRDGDQSWLTLVRWTLFALVSAEELGVTRSNLQSRLSDPAVRRALADDEETGRALGVERGWMVRAVQSAGSYGEMFERNLGSGTPLKLERGMNRLWTQGGLMYAPPVR